MMQRARNLLGPVDGSLRTAAHLIHDRDPLTVRAACNAIRVRSRATGVVARSSPFTTSLFMGAAMPMRARQLPTRPYRRHG